jgi:hypothetical protein
MRTIVILLALISAIFHLLLIALAKGGGLFDSRMLLISLLFVAWGMLPFMVLSTAGALIKMPKVVLTLGVTCLLALSLLFWDVYVSGTSSTAAVGLVTGPLILTFLILIVLGACAFIRYLGRAR